MGLGWEAAAVMDWAEAEGWAWAAAKAREAEMGMVGKGWDLEGVD